MRVTDAALDAGFSDSAHFSRTFRRMFGTAAAALDVGCSSATAVTGSAGECLGTPRLGRKIRPMKHDTPILTRRDCALALAAGVVVPLLPARAAATDIEVWTGPSCSCCHGWIDHLKASGFAVTTHDGGNTDARTRLGMPIDYGSCHTGLVEGYALEGHVPAREIHRLLAERPDAIGLSVPGMPRGSPGMESPVHDAYDVLLIGRDSLSSVFQSYR